MLISIFYILNCTYVCLFLYFIFLDVCKYVCSRCIYVGICFLFVFLFSFFFCFPFVVVFLFLINVYLLYLIFFRCFPVVMCRGVVIVVVPFTF